MTEEVAEEEQTLMAIKLADNVRKMIREEIKAALEDHGFLSSVYFGAMKTELFTGYEIRKVVRDVITDQMGKY